MTSKVVSFICKGASASCGKDLRPYFLLTWHPLPRRTYKQDVRSRTGGLDVRTDCSGAYQKTTHSCCRVWCKSRVQKSLASASELPCNLYGI